MTDISTAMALWQREGREATVSLPWNDIENALRQVPQPEAYAVSEDGNTLFLLGQDNTVFTVHVVDSKVTVISRQLSPDRMRVILKWDEPAFVTDTVQSQRTHWAFEYLDEATSREPWQDITGSVSIQRASGEEGLDERERFARTVARRLGWTGHVGRVDQDESMAEEPSASDTEQTKRAEPWWRAATDVWGRPLDPRRR